VKIISFVITSKVTIVTGSGVTRNLLMREGQAGGLEGRTPQWGSAAGPRCGSGGEVPRNWRQMCMETSEIAKYKGIFAQF